MEDVFSRLLGRKPKESLPAVEPVAVFADAWENVKETLERPDERQIIRGITSTAVPRQLQTMVDALVSESNHTDEHETGACLEYLLKNEVLSNLERLADQDRPFGIKANVLEVFNLLVALLDEKFLLHNAVHRPLRRLLRSCVGDEPEEVLDGQPRVVGAAGSAEKTRPSDYEKDLLELMCMLCKRIRSYPSLLMIFFHDKSLHVPTTAGVRPPSFTPALEDPSNPRSSSPTPSSLTSATGGTINEPKRDFEFLLFSYLLRFVHRESPIGEFSRAGLLFLIDVAFSGPEGEEEASSSQGREGSGGVEDPLGEAKLALAEYMMDGDFPEVLGAGLGAVYSLLPNKLVVKPMAQVEQEGGGMILGGLGPVGKEGEDEDNEDEGGISTSTSFRSLLDGLLKLLEFIQDVIRRISSTLPSSTTASTSSPQAILGLAMATSILNAVRSTFLEHVLYPSILECSDFDGSAVAVVSYIDVMLRTLEGRGRLVEVVLDFLMGEDDQDGSGGKRKVEPVPEKKVVPKKTSKHARRKSSAMILLETIQTSPSSSHANNNQMQYFTQNRFTLKDLLLDNLSLPSSLLNNSSMSPSNPSFVITTFAPSAGSAGSSAASRAAALKLLDTLLGKFGLMKGLLGVLPVSESKRIGAADGSVPKGGANKEEELILGLPELSFELDEVELENGDAEEDADDILDRLDGKTKEDREDDEFVYPGSRKEKERKSKTPLVLSRDLPLPPPPSDLVLPDWIAASLPSSSPSTPQSFSNSLSPVSTPPLRPSSPRPLSILRSTSNPPVEPPLSKSKDVDLYLNLLADIDPTLVVLTSSASSKISSETYAPYYRDSLTHLQQTYPDPPLTPFQLSLLSLSLPNANSNDADSSSSHLANNTFPSPSVTLPQRTSYRFIPTDPLLSLLLTTIRTFFAHTSEENLALTGVLATLALREDIRLEGWLIEGTLDPQDEEEEEDVWEARDGKNGARGTRGKRGHVRRQGSDHDPFGDEPDTQPVLFVLFRNLVRKIDHYRLLIPDFDIHLADRRRGLFFENSLQESLLSSLLLPLSPFPSSSSASALNNSTTDSPTTTSGGGGGLFAELGATLTSPFKSSSTSSSTPGTPLSRPKPKSKWSSFLSPRSSTPNPTPPAPAFASVATTAAITTTAAVPNTSIPANLSAGPAASLPYTPRRPPNTHHSTSSPFPAPTASYSTPQPKPQPLFNALPPPPSRMSSTAKPVGAPRTPYAAHYMATTSLEVESLVAESPSKGVWSPAAAAASKWGGGIGWGSGGMGGLTEENESDEEEEEKSRDQDTVEQQHQQEEVPVSKQVSLSQVLDNVVILEETLKELAGIVAARLARRQHRERLGFHD